MDKISYNSDDILSRILSFLPLKTAASTSTLSKRWKTVFLKHQRIYLVWNRDDYVEEIRAGNLRNFLLFVDNLMASEEQLLKFCVRCEDAVDGVRLTQWIARALARGGLLELCLYARGAVVQNVVLPSDLSSLVNLSMGQNLMLQLVGNAYHPRLETVRFDGVNLLENQEGLTRLLTSSPRLNELSMLGLDWDGWELCSVSSTSLLKLTLHNLDRGLMPTVVSLEAPALVFLDYTDHVSKYYWMLNLSSVIEAKLDLYTTRHDLDDLNASDIFQALSGVKTLSLSSRSLTVLSLYCDELPNFGNLVHLTLGADMTHFWLSLPILVNNCPKLETLVFEGNIHVCEEDDDLHCLYSPQIQMCLQSCYISRLELTSAEQPLQTFVAKAGVFLSRLPALEHLTVYYDGPATHRLKDSLERLPKASAVCEIEVFLPLH